MYYRVNYKENNQDGANYMDVADNDYELPSFLDYKEVLEYSISEGYINSEKDILSLFDGCDEQPAYFCSNTASQNCEADLSALDIDFNPEQWEYDAF